MRKRCEREIIELHEFFQSWYRGETRDFSRVEQALHPDFNLISPKGVVRTREQLLQEIHRGGGGRAGADFEIWITNCTCRVVEFGLALMTYEEWQRLDDRKAGRLSSALFRVKAETPNGVEWMHLHETWLPHAAPK